MIEVALNESDQEIRARTVIHAVVHGEGDGGAAYFVRGGRNGHKAIGVGAAEHEVDIGTQRLIRGVGSDDQVGGRHGGAADNEGNRRCRLVPKVGLDWKSVASGKTAY